MADKVLIQHPQGKHGVSISKARYELVRATILDLLHDYGEISLTELLMRCEQILVGQLEGAISWYTTRVKLDLESRGEIERVPGASPEKIRLKQG